MTSFIIETAGCSQNFADSEQMTGLLQEAQFKLATDIEHADIVIFNTCTVKGPTENNFFKRLEEVKHQYPYKIIVIAGCIPQTDPEKLKGYALVGTKSIHRIVEVVEEALNDNIIQILETGEMPPLNLPKLRKNPTVEIIPISRGCLSNCTFCKTKVAKGNLQSYPIEDIVKTALRAVKEDVKEIWLTSQDCFCYGFDIETTLPNLLNELVKIPGIFRIRLGMGNPIHLKKIKTELFPLLNHEKMFKFLHLPAQSGSDKILNDMKRGNTNKEFLEMVKELKETVPRVTLATDIIVGYPSETDEDYWETLNLVRKINPDAINISKFWPRPKTKAAELKALPTEVVKRRSKVLTDIFHNISMMRNERWVGWEGNVIIDEENYCKEATALPKESSPLPQLKSGVTHPDKSQRIGKNDYYKQVVVDGNYELGQIVKVKIEKAEVFALKGKVIE